MVTVIFILLLNACFAVTIFRASQWYKVKTEDYFYHMLALNLVAALLYVSKHFGITADQKFPLRFFASLFIVYAILWPFEGKIKRIVRSFISKAH